MYAMCMVWVNHIDDTCVTSVRDLYATCMTLVSHMYDARVVHILGVRVSDNDCDMG